MAEHVVQAVHGSQGHVLHDALLGNGVTVYEAADDGPAVSHVFAGGRDLQRHVDGDVGSHVVAGEVADAVEGGAAGRVREDD